MSVYTEICAYSLGNLDRDKLKALISGFWWGSKDGKRNIPWVAWKKLCAPKCYGGLGFRELHKFNMALLGKQAWRLLTNRECLMARVLLGKYCADGSVINADLGRNPSSTWRGIWEARTVLLKGVRRRVGDGLSTRVWKDPWISGTQTRRVLSPRGQADEDMVVADLMDGSSHGWN
ncbi:putative mitochondrial protein AtMg00310 [Silene latifolia]|uniref:putative mitochondrial protein AtMg00310 n=1 Tax=Silene latifolia TaxID=37657 RepID=UPI003D774BB6